MFVSSSPSTPTAEVDVDWNPIEIRKELRQSIVLLSQHCLKQSAKWASEQLIGLGIPVGEAVSEDVSTSSNNNNNNNSNTSKMSDLELYAKSLMELGEYGHAASVLSETTTQNDIPLHKRAAPPLAHLTSYGVFLRAYALYLAGEQLQHQEMVSSKSKSSSPSNNKNPYVAQLCRELEQNYNSRRDEVGNTSAARLDAFGLYIYGVCLKARDSKGRTGTVTKTAAVEGPTAADILMESILQFPTNWSAWVDLADLKLDFHLVEAKLAPQLQSHYMYHFFCAHIFSLHQNHEQALESLQTLMDPSPELRVFPNSPWIATKLATSMYHLRLFSQAGDVFAQVVELDPHRLDDLDIYSNILFVRGDSVALSKLAHTATAVDKYRPESCCIVGNYYSLKGQRTKAIPYFQRALQLDPSYQGAWTLLGHEYIELKNTPAAMEAYRKACEASPTDYRAWYGLGQTYEFLQMPLYALFYFRKATQLRPMDARMWTSVAQCYLSLGQRANAILALERAVSHQDSEGIATSALASLYQQANQHEQAAQCFLNFLELRYLATTQQHQHHHPEEAMEPHASSTSPTVDHVLNGAPVTTQIEAQAMLGLAQYYLRHAQYDTAAICGTRLLEYPGPEKEQGKALLRDVRSREQQQQQTALSSPSLQQQQDPNNMSVDMGMTPAPIRRGDEGEFSVDFTP